MKPCDKCAEEKPISLFPKRGNDCKVCVAKYMKIYRAANSMRISTLKKAWKLANKDYVIQRDKCYAAANPEKHRAARAKWRKSNQHIVNALSTLRKVSKLNRTPAWVDSEELWLIKEVYALAKLRTKVTKINWSVDHITPLQGELVSGLHTICNLQVIPAVMNSAKRNRFEVA